MKKITLLILITGLCIVACKNEKRPSKEDEKAKFINNEVISFWNHFDERDSTKRNQLLIAYALDSLKNPAINTIYKMTLNDSARYINNVQQYENYYKSIREKSIEMSSAKYPEMDRYYSDFKKMYPKAHRPVIIFTMGVLTVGGTVTDNGLVIGTEFYGKKSADTTGLGRIANFLFTSDDFIPLTFHEHMHYEQLKIAGGRDSLFNTEERTVLSTVLNEGAADFVSNLITGWNNDKPNYIYGNEHEEELWNKFQREMNSKSYETITNWMYDYNIEKDTPPDLGYFMGAKICESYYNNATDKEKAIEDILSIKKPLTFLKKSKYGNKFLIK